MSLNSNFMLLNTIAIEILDLMETEGIPANWCTILVGWLGFDIKPIPLTNNDIETYAKIKLQENPTNKEINRLTDVSNLTPKAIENQLIGLAMDTKTLDAGKEERRWRAALLIQLFVCSCYKKS